MTDSSQRTVKLRSSIDLKGRETQKSSGVQEINLTFSSMSKEKPPTADDYGVTDSVKASKLNHALNQFAGFNEVFFKWLEADAKNAILFANEPVRALKAAIPDFDGTVLTDLTDVFK